MKAAAIYTRVSTDEQTKGYSPQTQKEACLKYAEEQGYTVPTEYIYMEHYSGATLERPELDRLRQLGASGAISAVFVLDLDRLSRKVVYQMLIEEEFEKYKAPIYYVNSQYEDTPEGNLQKQIRATLAEFERAKFRERTLRGKKGRAQAGFVLVGRIAPYGYRYVKGERKGWLEIVDEEAKIVRRIYEWYVYGDDTGTKVGTAVIARRLSEMGIPTKNESGGQSRPKKLAAVWGGTTLKRILSSEVYAGIWNYNRTKRTSKNTHIAREKEEWIPVKVPAIISRELWEAAQRQRGENTIRSKRNTKRHYLLQGRLKCATCGHTFMAQTDARKPHLTKGYYYCGGQKISMSIDFKSKPCHRSLRQELWDERIWNRLVDILKNPDVILAAMETQQGQIEGELLTVREWLASLEKKINSLDQKHKKLLDLFLDDSAIMPREILSEKARDIVQEKSKYEREANDLRKKLEVATGIGTDIGQVREFCQKVSQGIDLFTYEDKQWAVASLKINGVVTRGATPDEDVIALTGYIPAMEIVARDKVVSIEAPTSTDCAPRLPPPPAPA